MISAPRPVVRVDGAVAAADRADDDDAELARAPGVAGRAGRERPEPEPVRLLPESTRRFSIPEVEPEDDELGTRCRGDRLLPLESTR